jgi:hypothetical protein
MYKEFETFQEGMKVLRKVSFSVRDVLCCVPEEASEEEVLRRLVIYATWEDQEWRLSGPAQVDGMMVGTMHNFEFGYECLYINPLPPQEVERRPKLTVSGSEVWYQTSGGLVFGWSGRQQPGRFVFYLRRPNRYGLRPASESSLIKSALEEGFLLESDEKAALRAASKA